MNKIVWITAVLIGVCSTNLYGQLTLLVKAPADTEGDIYVSGTFDNWSGGKSEYRLTRMEDKYWGSISPPLGKVEFKFTRGSWNQVEGTAEGHERDNREFIYKGGSDTLSLEIEGWKDASLKSPSTANERVEIMNEALRMPQLEGRQRTLRLYLPEGYKQSQKRYPVLYMHDAQALFDRATASYGIEWMIDEVLDSLYAYKGLEIIVVGIDNGGEKRIDEYSPWVNEKYGGGEGHAYMEFIVQTLKPYIDSHYRTLSDASSTGMMGSSMGGLITHYAGVKYPDVFGKVAVLSPSYWFSEKVYEFTQSSTCHPKSKWVMMAGDEESESMVDNMHRMAALLYARGCNEQHFLIHVEKGGKHSESTWQNLVAPAVLWMFAE